MDLPQETNIPSGEYVAPNRVEAAQKTFFYEKNDGTIFACHEQEAALFGKNYRLVGVSDGMTFRNYVRSHSPRGQIIPGADARRIIKEAFDAELEVARGHFEKPKLNNVHFDESYPEPLRASFVPPK